MDPNDSPAPVVTDSGAPDPAPADPSPAVDTPPEPTQPAENAPAADPQAPEPTGPAPDTNDPDLPDHGINPDKGIDPDKGDAPPNPDTPNPADPAAEANLDLKSMSRAERAEYFQSLDKNTRKQVEAVIDKAYQPQAHDELKQQYVDQGYDDFQADILARETRRDQQAQINEARAEIAELNAGLSTDAMEVVSTIDWLNPTKGEGIYDATAANAASQLYQNLCIVRDDNTAQRDAQGNLIPGTGQIIEAKMAPSTFYHLMDQIRSSGSETSRVSALKAAEAQMAAVAPPSSNTNRREAAFESKSAAEMRAELQAKGIAVT